VYRGHFIASFSAISLDTTEHSDAIHVAWLSGHGAAARCFPGCKTCCSPAFVVTTRYVANGDFNSDNQQLQALSNLPAVSSFVLGKQKLYGKHAQMGPLIYLLALLSGYIR
jgi:hypothetical protein